MIWNTVKVQVRNRLLDLPFLSEEVNDIFLQERSNDHRLGGETGLQENQGLQQGKNLKIRNQPKRVTFKVGGKEKDFCFQNWSKAFRLCLVWYKFVRRWMACESKVKFV